MPDRDPAQARPARRGGVGAHARAPGRSASASCARSPAWAASRGSCATSTSASTARGYPDGLAGEAIPLGSRIILACDAYHAMTSDRPYRAGDAARARGRRAGALRRLPVRPADRRSARGLPRARRRAAAVHDAPAALAALQRHHRGRVSRREWQVLGARAVLQRPHRGKGVPARVTGLWGAEFLRSSRAFHNTFGHQALGWALLTRKVLV